MLFAGAGFGCLVVIFDFLYLSCCGRIRFEFFEFIICDKESVGYLLIIVAGVVVDNYNTDVFKLGSGGKNLLSALGWSYNAVRVCV